MFMMEDLNQVPSFLQPNRPKKLSLDELIAERKRLTEVNRINRLNQERNKLLIAQKNVEFRGRQARVEEVKQVGRSISSIFGAGLKKVSEFDQSRANAKPLIGQVGKRKSIYD
jgi:hypothetical protein